MPHRPDEDVIGPDTIGPTLDEIESRTEATNSEGPESVVGQQENENEIVIFCMACAEVPEHGQFPPNRKTTCAIQYGIPENPTRLSLHLRQHPPTTTSGKSLYLLTNL